MVWFIVGCAVGVLVTAWFVGQGRLGGMPDPVVDDFLPVRPDRYPTPDEVRRAQFGSVPWGYSPAQVDEFLSQVADALEGRPIYGEVISTTDGDDDTEAAAATPLADFGANHFQNLE